MSSCTNVVNRLRNICCDSRKMFHTYNDNVDFDDTLCEFLVQLVEDHGEDWAFISEEFKALLDEDERQGQELVIFSPLALQARYQALMREVHTNTNTNTNTQLTMVMEEQQEGEAAEGEASQEPARLPVLPSYEDVPVGPNVDINGNEIVPSDRTIFDTNVQAEREAIQAQTLANLPTIDDIGLDVDEGEEETDLPSGSNTIEDPTPYISEEPDPNLDSLADLIGEEKGVSDNLTAMSADELRALKKQREEAQASGAKPKPVASTTATASPAAPVPKKNDKVAKKKSDKKTEPKPEPPKEEEIQITIGEAGSSIPTLEAVMALHGLDPRDPLNSEYGIEDTPETRHLREGMERGVPFFELVQQLGNNNPKAKAPGPGPKSVAKTKAAPKKPNPNMTARHMPIAKAQAKSSAVPNLAKALSFFRGEDGKGKGKGKGAFEYSSNQAGDDDSDEDMDIRAQMKNNARNLLQEKGATAKELECRGERKIFPSKMIIPKQVMHMHHVEEQFQQEEQKKDHKFNPPPRASTSESECDIVGSSSKPAMPPPKELTKEEKEKIRFEAQLKEMQQKREEEAERIQMAEMMEERRRQIAKRFAGGTILGKGPIAEKIEREQRAEHKRIIEELEKKKMAEEEKKRDAQERRERQKRKECEEALEKARVQAEEEKAKIRDQEIDLWEIENIRKKAAENLLTKIVGTLPVPLATHKASFDPPLSTLPTKFDITPDTKCYIVPCDVIGSPNFAQIVGGVLDAFSMGKRTTQKAGDSNFEDAPLPIGLQMFEAKYVQQKLEKLDTKLKLKPLVTCNSQAVLTIISNSPEELLKTPLPLPLTPDNKSTSSRKNSVTKQYLSDLVTEIPKQAIKEVVSWFEAEPSFSGAVLKDEEDVVDTNEFHLLKAHEFTGPSMKNSLAECVLVPFLPEATRAIQEISREAGSPSATTKPCTPALSALTAASQQGLSLVGFRQVYLEGKNVTNLLTSGLRELKSGQTVWLMLLRGPNALSIWRDLLGPAHPGLAQITDPDSLHARFGVQIATSPPQSSSRLLYEASWAFGGRIKYEDVASLGIQHPEFQELISNAKHLSPKEKKSQPMLTVNQWYDKARELVGRSTSPNLVLARAPAVYSLQLPLTNMSDLPYMMKMVQRKCGRLLSLVPREEGFLLTAVREGGAPDLKTFFQENGGEKSCDLPLPILVQTAATLGWRKPAIDLGELSHEAIIRGWEATLREMRKGLIPECIMVGLLPSATKDFSAILTDLLNGLCLQKDFNSSLFPFNRRWDVGGEVKLLSLRIVDLGAKDAFDDSRLAGQPNINSGVEDVLDELQTCFVGFKPIAANIRQTRRVDSHMDVSQSLVAYNPIDKKERFGNGGPMLIALLHGSLLWQQIQAWMMHGAGPEAEKALAEGQMLCTPSPAHCHRLFRLFFSKGNQAMPIPFEMSQQGSDNTFSSESRYCADFSNTSHLGEDVLFPFADQQSIQPDPETVTKNLQESTAILLPGKHTGTDLDSLARLLRLASREGLRLVNITATGPLPPTVGELLLRQDLDDRFLRGEADRTEFHEKLIEDTSTRTVFAQFRVSSAPGNAVKILLNMAGHGEPAENDKLMRTKPPSLRFNLGRDRICNGLRCPTSHKSAEILSDICNSTGIFSSKPKLLPKSGDVEDDLLAVAIFYGEISNVMDVMYEFLIFAASAKNKMELAGATRVTRTQMTDQLFIDSSYLQKNVTPKNNDVKSSGSGFAFAVRGHRVIESLSSAPIFVQEVKSSDCTRVLSKTNKEAEKYTKILFS